ncbi:MAG: hypothetical protein KDK30_13950, partial [Leptospiraceae bacterium]|nr:hypothetical protein [Leptospiraceae bacterium]
AIHLNGSTFMHTPSITLGKYVMAIVVRVNSGSANHILLEHGNNADAGDGNYVSASNACSILVQRGGVISGKALSANWAADDQFRLIAHVYNNSHNNNTLVVNGMAQTGTSNCTANADPGSANFSAALNIGGRAATSAAITGDIVEIFVYDREITAAEGKALFTYAGNRYNIPVSFNF